MNEFAFCVDISTESNIFENSVNKFNVEFMESITSYIEIVDGFDYLTEASKEKKDSLVVSIKKFFTNLIGALQSFFSSLRREIDKNARNSKTDSVLHKMYRELTARKEEGCHSVRVVDIWSLEKVYLDAVSDLSKDAKKFAKMKYTKVTDLDKDMAEFNKKLDKYETKLEEMSEKEIVVSIDKMIDFVQDEISGRSKVFDTVNDCIYTLETIRDDACELENRYEILGPDMIPKHIGFIRSITTKISKFVRKWVGKFVGKIVFIFA